MVKELLGWHGNVRAKSLGDCDGATGLVGGSGGEARGLVGLPHHVFLEFGAAQEALERPSAPYSSI